MAVHGKDTVVLFDEFDLSDQFDNSDWSASADVHETTTYSKDDKVYLVGLRDGTLSMAGLWDGAANKSDVRAFNAVGAAAGQIITVGLNGMTVGNRCVVVKSLATAYTPSAPVGDAVRFALDMQASGGVQGGVSLCDPSSSLTSTGNGTGVNNGASTSAGGVANIHVITVSGTNPTLDGIVQDSSDNITYGDLITFTQATAATKQQSTVTGTVEQWTRFRRVIGGTDTPTFYAGVGFARYAA